MAGTISKTVGQSETKARPLRFITATSLFDGHDAAINVMRRLIQAHGAEVIHLGHNRSVAEVVRAAVQENADAIAISSYQGGHMEYFRYTLQLLRASDAGISKYLVAAAEPLRWKKLPSLSPRAWFEFTTRLTGWRWG